MVVQMLLLLLHKIRNILYYQQLLFAESFQHFSLQPQLDRPAGQLGAIGVMVGVPLQANGFSSSYVFQAVRSG